MDQEEWIIWTNYREFTATECYESGFRDGRDGMRFYPCSEWDLVDGDAVRGNRTLACSKYAEGYKAGRIYWKEISGTLPVTGATHLD